MLLLLLLILSLLTTTVSTVVNKGDGVGHDSTLRRQAAATTTTTLLGRRHLQQPPPPQQTLNYRANYTANFQHFVHPSCTGDPPVLGLICYGDGMKILSVSHPSIECTKQNTSDLVEGKTLYGCVNTCRDDDTCESVYMVTNGVNAMDGPRGSIRFMCEGNTIQDVKAIYTYTDRTGNIGSCIADVNNATSTRNLRNAQLGISCPIHGPSSNNTVRDYVFDDTYFECSGRTTIAFDVASPTESSDVYSCFNGQDCHGESCRFNFDPIQILTNVPNFVNDGCVEALIPIDNHFPTAAPQQQAAVESSIYRVQFQAAWTTTNSDTQCTSTSDVNPTITITCDDNNNNNHTALSTTTTTSTTIVYDGSTDPTMSCINIDTNVLQCNSGDPNESFNQYTTVAYDCYGSNIPSSTVTYPESNAFCDNNVNAIYLSNSVTLGMLCNNTITSTDVHFECLESHHNFIVEESPLRYVCSEGTVIDSESSESNVQLIRSVSITTDDSWPRTANTTCYETSIDGTAPPVTISVPAPTLAPIPITTASDAPVTIPSTPVASIVAPIPVPPTSSSTPPVNTPIIPIPVGDSPVPIAIIFSLPPNALVAPPSATDNIGRVPSMQLTTNGDESNNSVLIIAVIGGVVGGILVSIVLFMVYNKGKNDGVAEHKDVVVAKEPDDNYIDPLDQYTEHNTESQSSPMTELRPTVTVPPTIHTAVASASSPLSPMTAATSDASYVLHYKDQSRSVIATASGRRSSNKYPPLPSLQVRQYYSSDDKDDENDNNNRTTNDPKPTSGIEVPMATAVKVTEDGVSMLGDSGSSIRYLGDSNNSFRLVTDASNHNNNNRSSNHILNDSNSTIPTESNVDTRNHHPDRDPPPPTNTEVEL